MSTSGYDDARDAWAKAKVMQERGSRIQNEITIESIEIDGGGSFQIGEMTWDYEDPSIVIRYHVGKRRRGATSISVTLDFGQLVREIVAVATTGKLPEEEAA